VAYVRVFHALYVLCMVSTLLQNIYHMSNIVSDFFQEGKTRESKHANSRQSNSGIVAWQMVDPILTIIIYFYAV